MAEPTYKPKEGDWVVQKSAAGTTQYWVWSNGNYPSGAFQNMGPNKPSQATGTQLDGLYTYTPKAEADRARAEAAAKASADAKEKTKTKISAGGLSKVSRESTSLRYPKEHGGIHDDADYVMFNFYDYIPPFNAKASTSKDYNQKEDYTKASSKFSPIIMYMPEDISSGFRAGWTGKSMSNLTAGALKTLGKEGLGNKLTSAVNEAKLLSERSGALVGAAAIKSIVSAVSGESLSYDDVFGAVGGAVLNPNTELLFNNIDLRNFSLSFKLAPRSQDEAEETFKIVEQFKRAMLPSVNPGELFDYNKNSNNAGVQLGFVGIPKLCRVSFMKASEEHPYLPRYKMCAITSVDVNYTPDGAYATFHDGRPVAMGLSLSFQETKIVFAEDLESGGVR